MVVVVVVVVVHGGGRDDDGDGDDDHASAGVAAGTAHMLGLVTGIVVHPHSIFCIFHTFAFAFRFIRARRGSISL